MRLVNAHVETAAGGPQRFLQRREQFASIREAAGSSPLALDAGDFNTPWHHPWLRDLVGRWSLSNPAGLAMSLTVPSILPLARFDYVFGTGGIRFSDHRRLVYARQVLGHAGIFTVAHLPPPARRPEER
ncbi:MAG TPA: hypothetical protein VNT60_09650 [Deinococcales bacterium]|nr:hypothetical protein [Deinococcales bacterium]